jgi:hypothetical protein
MTQFVIYVAAAIMFGFSAFTLFKVIKQSQRIKASREWPAITAQVTGKEVIRHRSSKGHVSYHPQVSYTYSVMGTQFSNLVRLPGNWRSTSAQKALDEFAPTLEVRYNPENPSESSHAYDKVNAGDYFLVVVTLLLGIGALVTQIK